MSSKKKNTGVRPRKAPEERRQAHKMTLDPVDMDRFDQVMDLLPAPNLETYAKYLEFCGKLVAGIVLEDGSKEGEFLQLYVDSKHVKKMGRDIANIRASLKKLASEQAFEEVGGQ